MIYEDRPEFCKMYPFEKRLDETNNVFSPRFKECQYHAHSGWLTHDELLQLKPEDEIIDYCNQCLLCCWLPSDGVFDFGDKNSDLDWSKIFVDKDYWLASTNKCEHCGVKDE